MSKVLRRLARRPVAIIATTLMLLGLAFATSAPAANAAVEPDSHGFCNNWRGFTFSGVPGAVMLPSIGTGGSTHCIMNQGAQSNGVRALQRALANCEQINPGPIDGIYGTQTRNAVIAFQRSAGIGVDGVYGPQTRNAMEFPFYTGGTTGSWNGFCAQSSNWP